MSVTLCTSIVTAEHSTVHNRALRVVIKLRAAKDVETKNSRNEMCVKDLKIQETAI